MNIFQVLKRNVANPMFLVLDTSSIKPTKKSTLKKAGIKDADGEQQIFYQGDGFDIITDLNDFIEEYDPDSIFTYSKDYFAIPWLDKYGFRHKGKLLDVLTIDYAHHCRLDIPNEVNTAEELNIELAQQLKGQRTGYTLKSVLNRYFPQSFNTAEQKLEGLYKLRRLLYAS
jgi:DNA polymerase elongation subunit (family B)